MTYGYLALASIVITGAALGLIWDFALSANVVANPSMFYCAFAFAYFALAGTAVGYVAHAWFEYGNYPKAPA